MGFTSKKLLTNETVLTGIRAWVNFQGRLSNGDATIRGGDNVASVTRVSSGLYRITLSQPMPNADYSVIVDSNTQNCRLDGTFTPTTTEFRVSFIDSAGNAQNPGYAFVLVSTDENAPKYEIQAWGEWNGITTNAFTGIRGKGFSTCQRISSGLYELTFSETLLDTNYAVFTGGQAFISRLDNAFAPTTTKFRVGFLDGTYSNMNPGVCHAVVIAPKGSPASLSIPRGKVRAWADFNGRGTNGLCTILDENNVLKVERISTGLYEITFKSSMRFNPLGSSFNSQYVVLTNNTNAAARLDNTSDTRTVDSFRVQLYTSTPALVDSTTCSVVVIQ